MVPDGCLVRIGHPDGRCGSVARLAEPFVIEILELKTRFLKQAGEHHSPVIISDTLNLKANP